MSTQEVDLNTASGKVFLAGALMAAAGGLMILALIVLVGLVAGGVIS